MAYDQFDYADDLALLSEFTEELLEGETFDIPPAVPGMRALDYEPDTDDYEYLQSTLY